MSTRIGFWTGSLVTAALLGVTLWAGDTPAIAQATQNNARGGAYLFTTYCAVCHGTNARGDGPLANSMRRRPADLTGIAKRNKGVYPSELVNRIIDGRTKVAGHGGPDMPVWGDAFMHSVEGGSEESVKMRIQALVDYLETLQARDAQ